MAQANVRLVTMDSSQTASKIGNVGIETLIDETHPRTAKHNNGSVLLRFSFGKTSYLFTGDIQAAAENRLVDEHANLRATILKVPHHGSKSSSTPEFIEAVSPKVAVISDGYMNRFHFPAPQVVDRYHDAGVKLFRTDLDGAIMTVATPERIELRPFRGAPATVAP